MPVHHWKRVKDLGLFHYFHQSWSIKLCEALNAGGLPEGYYALAEQRHRRLEPDILTLAIPEDRQDGTDVAGGVAVAEARPRTRFVRQVEGDDDAAVYAAKANRIAIRRGRGRLVAIIEIVSPGSKSSRASTTSFVGKFVKFINCGVHVLVVDLFPPTRRDPSGLHKAIWDEIQEEPFDLPPDKRLTLASYDAGPPRTAYIEPVAVGDPLPDMPLFLAPERYVPTPLETTYAATWAACPGYLRDRVESPAD